jgi:hypothetical protein
MKNVDEIKEEIKYFDRISEEEINEIINILCKMTWLATYGCYLNYNNNKNKDDSSDNNMNELLGNIVNVFNYFAANLNKCEEIELSEDAFSGILQAYLYNHLHFKKAKFNFNLDFLEKIIIIKEENNSQTINKKLPFEKFVKSVQEILLNDYKLKKLSKLSNLHNNKSENFLLPDYMREFTNNKGKEIKQLIFINNPNDCFYNSGTYSGLVKMRRNLSKDLNFAYLDIDFHEFLELNKGIVIDEDNYKELVNEFLILKLK